MPVGLHDNNLLNERTALDDIFNAQLLHLSMMLVKNSLAASVDAVITANVANAVLDNNNF